MKRFTLFCFLSIISSLILKSQSVYDPLNAEIIANKLYNNTELTQQEAINAVNYAIIGLSKIEESGEQMLKDYPAGSNWKKFHRDFEEVEEEYDATFTFMDFIDKFKNKLPDEIYAKYTISLRKYNSWYSKFCNKQTKYTNCPYNK